MTFVNPLEILEIENIESVKIEPNIIKKAKRKLFAEIELSDSGSIYYKGIRLNKHECEKALETLDNQILVEYYSHLLENKKLNDFLVNGDEKILKSFSFESIYKDKAFVEFISPYFAKTFNQILTNSFKNNDIENINLILRTQKLITLTDIDSAFRGLSLELDNRINDINEICRQINDEETEYTEYDIGDVLEIVYSKFPINTLNILPKYFQSQINRIARTINSLHVAVWNEFGNTQVCLQLLEHLMKLYIESAQKPIYQKNYEIVKAKHYEIIEQEKNAPILHKWANILIAIQAQTKAIENKSINSKEALLQFKELFSINELNNLPSYANEIRTQFALSIRSLSIACWNNQEDCIYPLFPRQKCNN